MGDRELSLEERTDPEKNKAGFNWLARNLGYSDFDNLLRKNGFKTSNEMLSHYGFSNWKGFLSKPGLYTRLDNLKVA